MSDIALATPNYISSSRIRQIVRTLVADSMRCDAGLIDTSLPAHTFGIDSLEAAALSRRLSDAAGAAVSMTIFLGDLSLDEIAADLQKRSSANDDTLISTVSSSSSGQLSHGQLALWAIHQSAPHNSAYNLPYALRADSRIDPPSMRNAFSLLIARHPVLRTSFPMERGKPSAQTHDSIVPDFQYTDKIHASDLAHTLKSEAAAPFSLAEGPLVRLRLYDVGAEDNVLLIVVHHIISDFWSITILLRDLLELYAGQVEKRPDALPEVDAGYNDFVALRAQQITSPTGEADLKYWSQALSGQLSPLELTADRPRPKQPTHRGAVHSFTISSDATECLRALGRETGATLFATVLSGFFALLHRYTGQDDIIVGVPTSGRDRREWLNLVGYFVNPVALRARFDGDPSSMTLVAHTRKTVLRAMNHQNYPFPLIVDHLHPKRDPSRSPVFQSMFVWQTQTGGVPAIPAALALGVDGVRFTLNSLHLETISTGNDSAQCDLTLSIAEHGDGLSAALKYSTELFDQETILRMAVHFTAVLKEMCLSPDTPVSALPL